MIIQKIVPSRGFAVLHTGKVFHSTDQIIPGYHYNERPFPRLIKLVVSKFCGSKTSLTQLPSFDSKCRFFSSAPVNILSKNSRAVAQLSQIRVLNLHNF